MPRDGSPTASGIALYRAALVKPNVTRLLMGGLLGRLREGGIGLGIVLGVRDATGSFPMAGAAAAIFAGFATLGRPLQGRLSTRIGARTVLIACTIAHSMAVFCLAVCVAVRPAPLLLLGLAAICGALLPALSAYLRACWPALLPDDRPTAYALDAVSYDVSNTVGPAIVAVLTQAADPSAALAAITLCGLIGTALAVTLAGPRPLETARQVPHGRVLRGEVSVLAALTVFVTFGEGVLIVAVPTVGSLNHAAAASGYLLSAFAVGSLAGGLVVGGRRWAGRPASRLTAFVIMYAVGLGLLASSRDLIVLAVLILLAGLARAPIIATTSLLIDSAAPGAKAVEAFSWISVAGALGSAAGQATAGILAVADVRVSFLAAAVVVAAAIIAQGYASR
jgi:MFS family permease